ncbi:RIP metalloprotease RseP [Tumebacillus sp. ITR2]|uniref:Zinc metalloprotease n=1 Tax=Tumebacillus amylolyticus TaxID=2801339 RepID=A0ABS1J626_9BACL|nr:RIP metalloprotease RseP [Tumebacillus amylolyticus]MBL0385742.1 RIP metalloprotease RseP [Tumebacillus amylolyticus]
MNIVMALLALGFLIFIHELGHFWAARAVGVRVEEFAIGFGPAIIKHKRKGIAYRLNWIPLGGYVKMLGEDNPEAADAPDSFNNRPIAARILVIVAGVIMNLLGAFVILLLMYNLYGHPTAQVSNVIDQVSASSPASEAGIKSGDVIQSVDGEKFSSFESFSEKVKAHEGQPMTLEIKRGDQTMPITVTPRKVNSSVMIGVQPKQSTQWVKQGSFGQSVNDAFTDTGKITSKVFEGFKMLVTGGVSLKEIGGPVEIVRITGEASQTGVPDFLYIVAFLSCNLAVLNIMPFPALDGGRLVFLIIEWLRRGKRIPLEREASINFIGILFLLTLMVVVTFKDVFKIFNQ